MSDPFAVFDGLVKGVILGKSGGDFAPESPGVAKRYIAVMETLEIWGGRLVMPVPEHGTNIGVYGKTNLVPFGGDANLWRTAMPCDGFLMTVNGRAGVAYMPADCHIMLLSGTKRKESMLMALHCGWRGIAGGILQKGIELLSSLGVERKDMRALVTPGIGPCCFEVKDDVLNLFKKNFPNTRFRGRTKADNRQSINLSRVIREEMISAGLDHYTIMSGCTKCSEHFWSHRRGDKERNIVVAALC